MKTFFSILVSGLFIHSAAWASTEVVDWDTSPIGEAPAIGSNHLSHFEWDDRADTIKVVDASSVPVFFSESQRALLITQPEQKGQWAIPVFDFYGAKPLTKGTFTMKAILLPANDPTVLSGFNIVLAPEGSEDLVQNNLVSSLARIRLTGDFAVQVFVPAASSTPIECEPRTTLQTPYEIRVDWDMTATPPYFTVFLDGVPVTDSRSNEKGQATRFPLTEASSSGVGAVMLRPRAQGSNYLIGRMEMGPSTP